VLQLIVVPLGEYPINRLTEPNPRLKSLIHVKIFYRNLKNYSLIYYKIITKRGEGKKYKMIIKEGRKYKCETEDKRGTKE
jgi:hypothetical protein